MGYGSSTVEKYRLMKTIGIGSFAKVKLAVDMETGERVAIKIIDKAKVVELSLVDQVKREISTMNRLHHPNIVRILNVAATKKSIFLIMEYVAGGNLTEKLSYMKKFSEEEARKYFQQLIDAIDHCHGMRIYHRDLKPQNLLIDSKGNLKVSDFGLSMLEQGNMLSTTCGTPHYVAPEVIAHRRYDGAAADIWSCGVILYELLAGNVPFDNSNTNHLYRLASRAEIKFPESFTSHQRKLIRKILNPDPLKRITLPEILEDEWFRIGYNPYIQAQLASSSSNDGDINTMDSCSKHSSFINAFQLIAMSEDLDLSPLFEEEEKGRSNIKIASEYSMTTTLEKIEAVAKDLSFSIERKKSSMVKLHRIEALKRSRSHIMLSAEVIPVTPEHCVIELSKSTGELRMYKEFCRSLSNILTEDTSSSSSVFQFSESESDNRDEDDDPITQLSDNITSHKKNAHKDCSSF